MRSGSFVADFGSVTQNTLRRFRVQSSSSVREAVDEPFVPVGVVESATSLDLVRIRTVYWKQAGA